MNLNLLEWFGSDFFVREMLHKSLHNWHLDNRPFLCVRNVVNVTVLWVCVRVKKTHSEAYIKRVSTQWPFNESKAGILEQRNHSWKSHYRSIQLSKVYGRKPAFKIKTEMKPSFNFTYDAYYCTNKEEAANCTLLNVEVIKGS